jgi:hypothetical protein
MPGKISSFCFNASEYIYMFSSEICLATCADDFATKQSAVSLARKLLAAFFSVMVLLTSIRSVKYRS